MRLVAKKMRTEVEEMEEAKVDVRKEDRTIRPFTIPAQQDLGGVILALSAYTILKGKKDCEEKSEHLASEKSAPLAQRSERHRKKHALGAHRVRLF